MLVSVILIQAIICGLRLGYAGKGIVYHLGKAIERKPQNI